MNFPHRKITEITHGQTIYTLSYQEADVTDSMTGWFLNLWRRSTGETPVEGTFGTQVTYKNCIIESNYGKTAEHIVRSAVAVFNNWLIATVPVLEAGKAPTQDEKQKMKEAIKVLLEKLTFTLVDGIPQVK